MEQLVAAFVCGLIRSGCTTVPQGSWTNKKPPAGKGSIGPTPPEHGSADRQVEFSCRAPPGSKRPTVQLRMLQRFHGGHMGAVKLNRCYVLKRQAASPSSNVTVDEANRLCEEHDDRNDLDSPTMYGKMFDGVDAIILNQGLHGSRALDTLLETVGKSIEKRDGPLAVWLQTSPQHFPSTPTQSGACPGDYWSRRFQTTVSQGTSGDARRRLGPLDRGIMLTAADRHPAGMDVFYCLPHASTSAPAACHHVEEELIMRRVLSPTAARRLQVVPAFDLLRGRWDLHSTWYSDDRTHPYNGSTTNLQTDNLVMERSQDSAVLKRAQPEGDGNWNGDGIDCTHFCFTPTLFAAMFGLIREGFERAATASAGGVEN